MIGQDIGRYRIIAKLGHGGMGSVWKARDERLARTVALKLLTDELTLSLQARRRFLREARAASQLNHPGIAAVYDAGETDKQLYLVTAYVDGSTLRERLRDGALPIAEAVGIASAVAEALQHAHEHGVIHRDISTANIMVGRNGHVTVIDFGLARLRKETSSRLTPTGGAWGTGPYIAPEILKDHEAGPRADLYSLGVVLYEMLTGAPPFESPALEALVNRILNEPPELPSRRRPDVPDKLDRIVLRALAKEPLRRYPSAAAMIRDLEKLALHAPALDLRAQLPSPPPKPRKEGATQAAEIPPSKFLAVLPFKDVSPSGGRASGAQMFARGLAETVSARLARVPGVHVIPPSALPSRTTSRMDLVALEQELGANLVLCGSVQRMGRQIRIGFSLVGPRRVQLAGDTLDGSMREILDLEDQLVRRIARSLDLEAASLATIHELPDTAAHEHYLQALGYLQRYENEASVDGAIRLLEKLARSEGGDARVHAALGRAYLAKYRLTFEPEWEKRAATACKMALKLDADLPEVLVTLGSLHREVGRYKTAIRDYQRALAIRPDDPGALVDLAWAYERADEIEMAEKTLRQAIALRPNSWRSYNHLGAFYFRQARYEEAAKAWQRVVELTPDNARGYSNLAAAYYHLERHEEALAAYDHSLEIRPDASAYTSLGTVYFFLGDRERAVQALEKAKALRPSDPKVWGNLADAYRWIPGLETKSGPAFDQAIALKRKQLKLDCRHGKGWAELAIWLAKRARFKEALQAIKRGLELSPHDVNCLALAVRVYHLAGDRGAALQWLDRAVRSGFQVAELERDPELAALREDADFQRIVKGRRASTSGMSGTTQSNPTRRS